MRSLALACLALLACASVARADDFDELAPLSPGYMPPMSGWAAPYDPTDYGRQPRHPLAPPQEDEPQGSMTIINGRMRICTGPSYAPTWCNW